MPDNDLRERIALAIEADRLSPADMRGVFDDGFDRGMERAARIARETSPWTSVDGDPPQPGEYLAVCPPLREEPARAKARVRVATFGVARAGEWADLSGRWIKVSHFTAVPELPERRVFDDGFDRGMERAARIARETPPGISPELVLLGHLVDAIRRWGQDEDGIPAEAFEWYERARKMCEGALSPPGSPDA